MKKDRGRGVEGFRRQETTLDVCLRKTESEPKNRLTKSSFLQSKAICVQQK